MGSVISQYLTPEWQLVLIKEFIKSAGQFRRLRNQGASPSKRGQ